MPHADITLPGTTSSVPTARRFVESVLSGWGHPDLGWAAAVCVSELAANCALHARTEFSVAVDLEGDVARVRVTDGSRRAPSVRDYGSNATTGRGLRLVGEYARDWGVDLSDDGKTVWVELAPEAPSAADGREDDDSPVGPEALRFRDVGPVGPTATACCAWQAAA